MDECCETCRYFCEVKKWPVYKEVLTHICILPFVQDGGNFITYITEAVKVDRCECWKERED